MEIKSKLFISTDQSLPSIFIQQYRSWSQSPTFKNFIFLQKSNISIKSTL